MTTARRRRSSNTPRTSRPSWCGRPSRTWSQRKRIGFQVILFLIVLSGLLYFTKKKVWHEVEAPRELAHGQDPSKTSDLRRIGKI